MKHFIAFLLTVFLIQESHAQTLAGGFEGPKVNVNQTTVAEALKMSDESRVSLVGQIINSLGDDKYTFKDQTGEVVIEIDDEDWQGQKVTPENTIEITGEIDKEFAEPMQIDVDSFIIKE